MAHRYDLLTDMRKPVRRFAIAGLASCAFAGGACGGDSGATGGMDGAAGADGQGRSSGGGDGGRDGGRDATTDAATDGPSDDAADRSVSDATFDATVETGSSGAGGAEGGEAGGADGRADGGTEGGGPTGPSVLQHHNNATRDGFYVDPALATTAIHTMHLDSAFNATTSGQTFSQPLFMTGGVNGQDALFVATENNDVYALDPKSGGQLWTKHLGAPVTSGLGCPGSINPLGVTGTPIIDPVARALYLDAAIGGGAPKHTVFSLSIDTGNINWSLDVSATIAGFDSSIQNQRGALALLGGRVFVPYGGLDGDCGNYKGWVVGVPVNSPTAATGWATAATSGPGIWGPSGIASDGTSLYVATGNTTLDNPMPTVWANANSEAIIRLSTAPAFSGNAADYFAPTDWLTHDQGDDDLGSSGVVLFDAPSATPKHLAFAVGKTAVGRVVDQANLGGIGDGISHLASTKQVFGALFAYTTTQGTYVGAQGTFGGCSSADFSVLKVSNTAQLSFAWCAASGGTGGPISSSTSANGSSDSIVWSFGAAGDGLLRAWDADTGANLFTASAAVGGTVEHWTSPIIANGRVYVAGDGSVYAFGL